MSDLVRVIMTNELLLEIGTEEIPAGFLEVALASMGQTMAHKLDNVALAYERISCLGTPRRLTVCIQGLAPCQPDRHEEILGPPKAVSFDQHGKPTRAAEGFAKSQAVSVAELCVVATIKGEYVAVRKDLPGVKTEKILVALCPEFIGAVHFSKSMRWGTEKISFARPIRWIVAVYNGDVVPFSFGGVESGNLSRGHRFMASGEIIVRNFTEYQESLREAYVLVDSAERRAVLQREIAAAATEAGGKIRPDEELEALVTNLVEYPVGVCGTFDERYLALPQSVLITAMREHQKYFAVVDDNGGLRPKFVAVNNTVVRNAALTIQGHQRVLRARLEDALFFFEKDQQTPLAERVPALEGVIFQAKLGSLFEKTQRVRALTGYLATALSPQNAAVADRAAYLAKSDLLTAMVNEFPSLQGTVGRDYALLQGESKEVATAIAEHYLPVRAGGPLPTGIAGALVGLADRMDSIVGCFIIGQTPTGTTDPFGLRRLALGILNIILDQDVNFSLVAFVEQALAMYSDELAKDRKGTQTAVLDFFKGRFVNDMIGRGFAGDVVEAVTSVAFDDIVDVARRIQALAAIRTQSSFTSLAGAFKRVMNIIKGVRRGPVRPEYLTEEAEQRLFERCAQVRDEVRPLLERKDYVAALEAILQMKAPVDLFFDKVMVMAEDQVLRENRVALLAAVADMFLAIGDFSKIQAAPQGKMSIEN